MLHNVTMYSSIHGSYGNETQWNPMTSPSIPMNSHEIQAVRCDTSRPSLALAVSCARCSWLLWGPWGTLPPGTLGPWDLGFMVWWKMVILPISWYGYGSIPINTIFSGMNIHKSQLFWGSPGVQGFDPSPYEWSISPISIQKWMVHHGTSSIIG